MLAPRTEIDLLYGLAAIADHLGISERQAKHRAATGDIPTFHMGQIRCALKSAITENFAARSAGRSAGEGEGARHG